MAAAKKHKFVNKFFVVTAAVALTLTVAAVAAEVSGYGFAVGNAASAIIYPFQTAYNFVAGKIGGAFSIIVDYNKTRAENAQLKDQLAALNQQIDQLQKLQDQNDWLNTFLGVKTDHPDYAMQPGNVIARSGTALIQGITLDCGSAAGVKPDMPVVESNGLVGYIDTVNLTNSRVRTILDVGSSVAVYVDRTGQNGFVEGDFALGSDGLCKLVFYDSTDSVDLQAGDVIYTSGAGNKFPRGYMVGAVQQVLGDANTHMPYGVVKPNVYINSQNKMMVITAFNPAR